MHCVEFFAAARGVASTADAGEHEHEHEQEDADANDEENGGSSGTLVRLAIHCALVADWLARTHVYTRTPSLLLWLARDALHAYSLPPPA